MEFNLLLSSLVFVTNAAAACYKEYYLYGFLFGGLTVTSLLVHSDHDAAIVDKFFILSIVVYGGRLLYQKRTDHLGYVLAVALLFLGVLFLYLYGYAVGQYCFHPELGNMYHGLLHLASSVGHHLIILL